MTSKPKLNFKKYYSVVEFSGLAVAQGMSEWKKIHPGIFYTRVGINISFKHYCPDDIGRKFFDSIEYLGQFKYKHCMFCDMKFPERKKLDMMVKLHEFAGKK